MPRVQLVRGVVVGGLARNAGESFDADEWETRRLLAYGDAVVVPPTVGERQGGVVAEHRDGPAKGRRR